MLEEVWKEIAEAPDYEVSNLGRIASKKYKNRRILKQNKKNILHNLDVNLYKNSKTLMKKLK